MLAPFALAILLGAALLFTLQPMVAKMLLPLLGGSPSVWNTCMVFFQAGLLGGYAYAHLLSTRLRIRGQVPVHALALLLPALSLPFAVRGLGDPPADGSPAVWLLGALALTCGLPFLIVSTTGPLLQEWFSRTRHKDAADPYFLYAASNLGSFGGLLAYPFLLEPWLPLGGQARLWTAGYVVYALLVAVCAAAVLRRPAAPAPAAPVEASRPIGWGERLRWIAYAFVPSSLLLGTTQYLTTDIAAIPLLWVVPLALYLLTFVAAFARPRPRWLVPGAGVLLAFAAVGVAVTTFPGVSPPSWVELGAHVVALFAAGLVCHGRLSDSRPGASRLTEFYLLVALGGVLGGAFNALVAPLVFRDLYEYPIALAAACFLRARWGDEAAPRREVALDLVVPALLAAYLVFAPRWAARFQEAPHVRVWIEAGLPGVLCLATLGWRRRFGLSFAVLLAFSWIRLAGSVTTIHQERTFFGVHRVLDYYGPPYSLGDGSSLVLRNRFHVLLHGPTRHGTQSLDPRYSRTPTTYFHRTGPIGQVFDVLRGRKATLDVGLIGLGAGTIAAYGEKGDRFTIYDIDPAVVGIATNPKWFTYVSGSPAEFTFRIGDGRLKISEAQDASYDLVILDAFSSDAIPVHLLTREAVSMYRRKLKPGGLIAFHVSNQYVSLAPVIDAIGTDLGMTGGARWDRVENFQETIEGKDESTWVILAGDPDALAPFAGDGRWYTIPQHPGKAPERRFLWTDAYSNVVGAMKWRNGDTAN